LRQRHGFQHGFPLIRSLRASAQRSTSVLFSFCSSLVEMWPDHSPSANQKTILACRVGLQKVSAQLELSKAAPRTVLNNQLRKLRIRISPERKHARPTA
jgi:hypothetical protein